MSTLQTTLSALEAQLLTQQEELQNYTDGVYEKNIAALEIEITDFITNHIGIDIDPIDVSINGSGIVINTTSGSRQNQVNIYYRESWLQESNNASIELSWYGSSCDTKDVERINYLSIVGAIAKVLNEIEYEYINKWQVKYGQYRASLRVWINELEKTKSAIQEIKRQMETSELESYKKVGFKCTIANSNRCARDYKVERGAVGDYYILSSNEGIKMKYSYSKYDYAYLYAFEILSKGTRNRMTIKVLINSDATNPLYREYSLTEKFFNEFIEEVFDWQTKSSVKQLETANREFERNATKQESVQA